MESQLRRPLEAGAGMNEYQEEELVESVAYAISQTCDMDVTWEMYARAAIAAYRETKAKLLAETENS